MELPLLNRACRPIPADGEALIEEYNAELGRLEEHGENTWFTAPWLYAEYALTVPQSHGFFFHAIMIVGVTCELPRH